MNKTQLNTTEPVYHKLHRVLFAACILLTPLALSAWFGLCPQYGDPACPTNANPLAAIIAFRAANPVLMQVFLFLNLVVPYLFPLSYLGLGLLAMKRSPWLATIGIACGWVGSIPWGFIADQSFTLNGMARLSHDAVFATLEKVYFSNWEILAIAGGWVIGHLLGYVLLGIALARARVVPLWAACLIVFSAPLMGPIAYGTRNGTLQVLGYVLVFLGSIPAAIAMLKGKHDI